MIAWDDLKYQMRLISTPIISPNFTDYLPIAIRRYHLAAHKTDGIFRHLGTFGLRHDELAAVNRNFGTAVEHFNANVVTLNDSRFTSSHF
jgi:hypothetical protein